MVPRTSIELGGELALTLRGSVGGFTGERIFFVSEGSIEPGSSFDNVAFGERITTTDGLASFELQGDFPTDSLGSIWLAEPNFLPEWDAEPYIFSVSANPEVGTIVGVVSATDPDNDSVSYSIEQEGFSINSTTGEIQVTDSAVFVAGSAIEVDVTVTDNDLSNVTTVIVNVQDSQALTNGDVVNELLTGPGGPFENQTDPDVIGFDADSDRDGISNVFELWLGTDPSVRNTPPAIQIVPSVDPDTGGEVAVFEVAVASGVDDLFSIDAFFTFNLFSFRQGDRSVVSDDGVTRVIRFTDTSENPGGRAFFQFRIDSNAPANP